MKWCGAFLFGAIVLPIVILNFVVAFVLAEFSDYFDLARERRFFVLGFHPVLRSAP